SCPSERPPTAPTLKSAPRSLPTDFAASVPMPSPPSPRNIVPSLSLYFPARTCFIHFFLENCPEPSASHKKTSSPLNEFGLRVYNCQTSDGCRRPNGVGFRADLAVLMTAASFRGEVSP